MSNDGTTALPVSPVQTEEDTMKLASFFNSLAEKVVQASTLPKELEKTQSELTGLKHDFEAERNHATMLDQQLLDMRNQRNTAEDELAKVRQELEETKRVLGQSEADVGKLKANIDHTTESYTRVVHERDEYGMKAMQLEDELGKTKDTLKHVKESISALFPEPAPVKPEPAPEPAPVPQPVQAGPDGYGPGIGQSSPEASPSPVEPPRNDWEDRHDYAQEPPQASPEPHQDDTGRPANYDPQYRW